MSLSGCLRATSEASQNKQPKNKRAKESCIRKAKFHESATMSAAGRTWRATLHLAGPTRHWGEGGEGMGGANAKEARDSRNATHQVLRGWRCSIKYVSAMACETKEQERG